MFSQATWEPQYRHKNVTTNFQDGVAKMGAKWTKKSVLDPRDRGMGPMGAW